MSTLTFHEVSRDNLARTGIMQTAHSTIATPCFMPVGTNASIKAITNTQVAKMGYPIILANIFHLLARNGVAPAKRAGGLHSFIGWDKSILTDSGGYQVFSLSKLTKKNDAGVRIQSPWDGSWLDCTPESIITLQFDLGVDIAMCLDDCVSTTGSIDEHKDSIKRTANWAQRTKKHIQTLEGSTACFGIIQGGLEHKLRQESLEALLALEFPGYALGGLAVGESREERYDILASFADKLPRNKPRYVMGIGTPLDIVDAVSQGVDIFDCVLPTRNARNGYCYTSKGIVRLKNAIYATDDEPLDLSCNCQTCKTYSKSYLRYLFMHNEFTSSILLTQHNLYYYKTLCEQIQSSITCGKFKDFYCDLNERYENKK